jgi:hypothetical protein
MSERREAARREERAQRDQRPPRNRAVPIAALAALGLSIAFGGGWLFATAGDEHLSATRLAGGATGSAPSPAPGTQGAVIPGGLPTAVPADLPTGTLVDAAHRAAADVAAFAAQRTRLPALGKLSKPPVPTFRCPRPTVRVSTTDQLDAALQAARPGTVIGLADGVYQEKSFRATRSGTARKPIYLCGGRKAVLDGGSITGGYVLHLDNVAYWRVSGFTVRNGQKGVMADGARRVAVQNLLVERIGDEAVHLRDGTVRSVVRGLTIRTTGLRKPKFGEGVYVGSAQSNWCAISDCKPDQSDGNYVLDNRISGTSSESVDIKEGTIGGVVARNSFDGAGITGADSWVDVKGNGWLIAANKGTRAPYDGYQTHEILDGWGDWNLFSGNSSAVRAAGYAFKVTKPHSSNVVRCNNKETGAGQGLTNVACRR